MDTNTRKRNPHRFAGLRYSDKEKARAVELAEKGHTVPEIAKKLRSPSQKTIREWLISNGVTPPSGRKRVYDRKKILADLRARKPNGKKRYTRAQLQAKYHCSAKFLWQLDRGIIKP
jgi:transposase-like protein